VKEFDKVSEKYRQLSAKIEKFRQYLAQLIAEAIKQTTLKRRLLTQLNIVRSR
jgi:hypothetical protein